MDELDQMLETICLDDAEALAPVSAARFGVDLTGTEVTDRRFAPYNRRLDENLARLLHEKASFYFGARERNRRRTPRAPLVHTDEWCRPAYHALYSDVGVEHGRKKIWSRIFCNESREDGMTSDVVQALLMVGGILCLMVFAFWAFWFLERFRGGNATGPGAQRR